MKIYISFVLKYKLLCFFAQIKKIIEKKRLKNSLFYSYLIRFINGFMIPNTSLKRFILVQKKKIKLMYKLYYISEIIDKENKYEMNILKKKILCKCFR